MRKIVDLRKSGFQVVNSAGGFLHVSGYVFEIEGLGMYGTNAVNFKGENVWALVDLKTGRSTGIFDKTRKGLLSKCRRLS